MSNYSAEKPAEQIPDHELVRCIGRGSYGQVWLARNVIGAWRAIKIINRKTFPAERPFEREFNGIVKFEPISRTHPGFVSILHVGRNQSGGYFYYVMEVADDQVSGQNFDPESYDPKTLSSEMRKQTRMPLNECVRVALSLTHALNYLHEQGLVHRDIKPSNIIFVNGTPKFADIGLVADIGDSATFVGTEGYVPPEGPGRPSADIYSLGKVLYEIGLGKRLIDFPELPTHLGDPKEENQIRKLYEIILKSCELNARKRFQSAREMHDQLAKLRPRDSGQAPKSGLTITAPPKPLNVAILYQPGAQPDEQFLNFLQDQLLQQDWRVFVDKHTSIDVQWAREIEDRIAHSDAVVVLLSRSAVESEMIAYEIEIAHQAARQQSGRPRLLPVRVEYEGRLPGPMASVLDPLHHFVWSSPADNQKLAEEIIGVLRSADDAPLLTEERPALEPIGGAVPLDSKFYVIRLADEDFEEAITRGDSFVLVKGARQMGKTSLLARGLQRAREEGSKVVLTDFQKLNADNFETLEKFFLALGESLADQLDLHEFPSDSWDTRRSPNTNFERYLRRHTLEKLPTNLVWGMDEVDRLFTCPFGTEVFGLFRSWHNKRALEPHGPWSRITLAVAYATEANLFITDLVQSPFNIGTRVVLDDFTSDQVAELNRRYGNPLKGAEGVARFSGLVGGQPFLVRRGLHELATQRMDLPAFEAQADRDEGIFGDHLRRIMISLAKDSALMDIVKGVLQGRPCPDSESFYRLRSAGLMVGESPETMRPRCQLYANFLRRHLL